VEHLVKNVDDTEFHLEVHWDLLHLPLVQDNPITAWGMRTSVPARLAGMNVTVLNPEAELLYLCAHLFLHHGGGGPLWLRDIAELLAFRSAQYDWDEILSRAQEFDLVLPLQRAFKRLENDHWGAPLMPGVRERVMSLQPTQIETANYQRTRSYIVLGVSRRYWLVLQHAPDWRVRLPLLWHTIFPDPSYMRERYKIQRLPLLLLYPYRWWLGVRSLILSAPATGMQTFFDRD
jgi:Uncharacterised nucleotidyltransferase